MLLCVVLLSPRQPTAPVISSSASPAANLPPLQSKAGIAVQANYAVFGLERVLQNYTFNFLTVGQLSVHCSVCTSKPEEIHHLA